MGKDDGWKQIGVLLERCMGCSAAEINKILAQGSLHGVTKRKDPNIEPDHMQATD